jgi:hypothetical protein
MVISMLQETPLESPRIIGRLVAPVCLALVAGCGGGSALSGSGGGGGGSEGNPPMNLESPYEEIQLASPSALPAPEAGEGVGGVTSGADFAPAIGSENVIPWSSQARFSPNWTSTTQRETARLAWATYWLDMSDQAQATELTLDWFDEPLAEDIWIGFSNWDLDQWDWQKLTIADTIAPPISLGPFIRNTDHMLACAILVVGSTPATLNALGTNQESEVPLINLNSQLGTNLGEMKDWSPATVFVDVFKTSRAWIPQDVASGGPWDNGNSIAVDGNGWVTSLDPGQAVATVMMTGTTDVYPAGEYLCLYDGEGTIEFQLNGSIAWSQPGRMGVNISGQGMVVMRIIDTNPSNYIRNIRFIMPGFENSYQTQVFHPDFLRSLDNFTVLRYMDWGATNFSTVQSWAGRTTLSSSTQTRNYAGVCLEHMADLSNATLADPWICIPYLADDEYVRKAATLMHDRLDPSLRIFVEYSNETWNPMFAAAAELRRRGLELGLSPNPFEAQLRYTSQRSQEVHAIFSEIFADRTDRLVRVISSQSANPWTGTTVMDWSAAEGNVNAQTVADRFDYYAVAPYFGGYLGAESQASATETMTLSEIFDALDVHSLAINGPVGITAANALNASTRGISLITYEGGQHLAGVGAANNNQILTDLFIATNRDMRMEQMYLDDLRRWTNSSNSGLFIAFTHIGNYSKAGSWGILETQGQDLNTAPKWLGLMAWLAEVSAAD